MQVGKSRGTGMKGPQGGGAGEAKVGAKAREAEAEREAETGEEGSKSHETG